MKNEVEAAERQQAIKAFLIPSGLFVACLFNAAGMYIMYSGNAIGAIFLGIGLAIVIAGLFAFVTFENKHRSKGRRVSPEVESYMPPSAQRRTRPQPEVPLETEPTQTDRETVSTGL